ncbi:hypothetical protein KAR91_37805, partial [Candidatus Pacearchaeota archaeon]|nr:hypothetical protein [Candidatus Pacearchaeota archaeon]
MAASSSIFGKLFKKITSEKRVSLPDYVKRVAKTGELPSEDSLVANKDLLTLRYGQTTYDVIRQLSKFSPDLSAAVFSFVRLSITRGYTLIARDFEGGVNTEATTFVQQIAKIFDSTDDAKGFNNAKSSIRSLAESLALELVRYGALCG